MYKRIKRSKEILPVVSSIDIVTEKEIVCIWKFASDPKYFQQIKELAVDMIALLYYQYYYCNDIERSGDQKYEIIIDSIGQPK